MPLLIACLWYAGDLAVIAGILILAFTGKIAGPLAAGLLAAVTAARMPARSPSLGGPPTLPGATVHTHTRATDPRDGQPPELPPSSTFSLVPRALSPGLVLLAFSVLVGCVVMIR